MTSNSKKQRQRQARQYSGSSRFIEIGSPGAPFRSLINADDVRNIRFEQDIQTTEPEYNDEGEMTAPPQQFMAGWLIIIEFRGGNGQNIAMPNHGQAAELYNTLLDMIAGTGIPMARQPRLEAPKPPSGLVGPDGLPVEMSAEELEALGIDEPPLPGEVPDLTEEELDALENPEIDVDAIADAVKEGVGDEQSN